MRVAHDQKPKTERSSDTGYELSQVTDGLWTVEGAYSAPSGPADYFKPSPLYIKVLSQKNRPSRPGTFKIKKRSRALERARTRGGRGPTR